MTETQNPGPGIDLVSLVGTWRLNPAATTVQGRTKAMWGMATASGSLSAVDGSGTVGDDGAVPGTLVIDAASTESDSSSPLTGASS